MAIPTVQNPVPGTYYTTASSLITRALKNAGVIGLGQPGEAEDIQEGLQELNEMLAQWQTERWHVFTLKDSSIVSTGAQFYTVGDGQDFNIPAVPDRLEFAYCRQLSAAPNAIDTPLEILAAHEDYAKIALKSLAGFPTNGYAFYDSNFPVSKLFVWPIPPAGVFEVHILTKAILGQIQNLGQPLLLPAVYYAAIRFNLGLRFRVNYTIPAPAGDLLPMMARDSLATLRGSNFKVPRLQLPAELTSRHGAYNVFSDQA